MRIIHGIDKLENTKNYIIGKFEKNIIFFSNLRSILTINLARSLWKINI